MGKLLWLGWVASLALACGRGSEGGGAETCQADESVCEGSAALAQCRSGNRVTVPCRGPRGCEQTAEGARCDVSEAAVGEACPSSSEGVSSCAPEGSAWVQCRSGTWVAVASCTSCTVGTRGVSCAPVLGGAPGGGVSSGPSLGPCGEVSTSGRCATPTRVEFCSVPTGNGTPFLDAFDCPAGQSCMLVNGRATCSLTGACVEGGTRCAGGNQLETCTNGAWVAAACPGRCASSPIGSFCAAPVASTGFSAQVAYEARTANESRTDWSSIFQAPAPGFLVLSYANGELLDAAMTDANGGFSLQVPATPGAQDAVVVALAASDEAGALAYLVADPGFDAVGVREPNTVGPNPRLWGYSFSTASLSPGATLLITEAIGSGAARVYDQLRFAYAFARARYGGAPGKPLVVWLGFGNAWTCGSCYAAVPVVVFGTPFDSQLWLSGTLDNQEYWADSVTVHELGHWTMDSYGFPPTEGGPHKLAVPTFPGQAWSEGFATWFSSNLRQDSVYLDKQQGTMFWLDLGLRSYSLGVPWQRPTPPGGLQQMMDENEVAAILWNLSGPSVSDAMYGAISSPRMTARPFVGRGYTQHVWDVGQNGEPINVLDTGDGIPFLADYLDALVCGGFSRDAVGAATQPDVSYPYPLDAPLCTP